MPTKPRAEKAPSAAECSTAAVDDRQPAPETAHAASRLTTADRLVAAAFSGVAIWLAIYVGADLTAMLIMALFVVVAIALLSGSECPDDATNAVLHSFQRFPYSEAIQNRTSPAEDNGDDGPVASLESPEEASRPR